jgi:predicted transposase/invertase (TIGR01784 family)
VYYFGIRIILENFALTNIKTDFMSAKVSKRKSGQKYAELLCDFMFKRMFGSKANKDVLIGFLNMILEDAKIVDVDFIPTEHYGLTEQDRKAVFDISCTCDDGRTLIIEMQKGYQEHFRKRAVYYTSYPICEQGRLAREKFIKEHQCKDNGEEFRWDFNLKPVTVVAILNFMFDHDASWPEDRYHSSYRLREDCTNEIMTDVLRYVFLELGRFRKRIWELETTFDKWMYLLGHMHEMVDIPENFQSPEFKRLFILAEIGNFTASELKEYENSLKSMSDYYNIIDSAEKRAREEGLLQGRLMGLAEGRAEGHAEGRAEERRMVVQKLIASGMSVESVSKILQIPEDELKKML